MADDAAVRSKGEHLREFAFKPGQSGNPAGRSKGTRVKLGEQFLDDLKADWDDNGKTAIEAMRAKSPVDYVKVVAATLPKELNVKVSELDDLSDDEIARQLAGLAAQLARANAGPGEGAAEEIPAKSLN